MSHPVSGRHRALRTSLGSPSARPVLAACACTVLIAAMATSGVGAATAAPVTAGELTVTMTPIVASAGAAGPEVTPVVAEVVAPYQMVTWQRDATGEQVVTEASQVLTVEQAENGTSWSYAAVDTPSPLPPTTPPGGAGGVQLTAGFATSSSAPNLANKPATGIAALPTPGQCPDSGLPVANGLTPNATEVLDCLHAVFPAVVEWCGIGYRSNNSASDHPAGRAIDAMIPGWDTQEGRAYGWTVAHYVEVNASQLNVKYVIFDAQIFIPGSGWRPYRHPSGATDANALHLNHVHVSVY